jgi:hypothetical protein
VTVLELEVVQALEQGLVLVMVLDLALAVVQV